MRLSQLRKTLGHAGALIVKREPGYVLRLEPEQLDLHVFGRLVGEADAAEPATAAVKLREALSLWRGPPLADVYYESFAQPAIARVEELRLVRLATDLALALAVSPVGGFAHADTVAGRGNGAVTCG